MCQWIFRILIDIFVIWYFWTWKIKIFHEYDRVAFDSMLIPSEERQKNEIFHHFVIHLKFGSGAAVIHNKPILSKTLAFKLTAGAVCIIYGCCEYVRVYIQMNCTANLITSVAQTLSASSYRTVLDPQRPACDLTSSQIRLKIVDPLPSSSSLPPDMHRIWPTATSWGVGSRPFVPRVRPSLVFLIWQPPRCLAISNQLRELVIVPPPPFSGHNHWTVYGSQNPTPRRHRAPVHLLGSSSTSCSPYRTTGVRIA